MPSNKSLNNYFDNLEKEYLQKLSEQERKVLGQVFTPRYIIRFMLNHLDQLLELPESPPTLNFKILDPACGPGRFLLETYHFFEKKFRAAKWTDQDIRKALLSDVLYGVDIEPLAIEFIYLALLEKKGAAEIDKINVNQSNILAQDPLPSQYDMIIGNPPYFLISQEGKKSTKGKQFHTTFVQKKLIDYYQNNYKSWPKGGQDPNIFYLFIERSIQLLREGGFLGFIIPDILLSGDSTENLRKFILDTCCIKKIIAIEGQVFEDIGISNIIIILQRCSNLNLREENKVEVINTSTLELEEMDKEGNYSTFDEAPHLIPQAIFYKTPQNNFAIRITGSNSRIFLNIFTKLESGTFVQLGDVVEIQRGIENLKRKDALDVPKGPKRGYQKLITASNIDKYQINWEASQFSQKYIDYNPQDPAYSHINFKQLEWFRQPKIVLKRVSSKLVAAIDIGGKDESDYFFTLDSVQMLWLKEKYRETLDLRIILALLNSDFMNFYYHALFSYKKLFSRVQKAFLLSLPIPSEIDQAIQKQICDLVDQLVDSYDSSLDSKLNHLIYSLYFTSNEINQFEGLFEPPISLRDLPGIGLSKYWELRSIGIKTIDDLINCDSTKIVSQIKGIGTQSIAKWKKFARELIKK